MATGDSEFYEKHSLNHENISMITEIKPPLTEIPTDLKGIQ